MTSDDYSYFGNDLIAAARGITPLPDLGPLYFSHCRLVAKFDRNGNALWALGNGVSYYEANFRGIATTPGRRVGQWLQTKSPTLIRQSPIQGPIRSIAMAIYITTASSVIFFSTEGGLLAKIQEAPVAIRGHLAQSKGAGNELPVPLPIRGWPDAQYSLSNQSGVSHMDDELEHQRRRNA